MFYFKDIGKRATDFLDKDFFFVKKLSIKAKNDSDIEFKVDGELSTKGTKSSFSINRKSTPFSLESFAIKSDGKFSGIFRFLLDDELFKSNI
jgi:hypothetical protein